MTVVRSLYPVYSVHRLVEMHALRTSLQSSWELRLSEPIAVLAQLAVLASSACKQCLPVLAQLGIEVV